MFTENYNFTKELSPKIKNIVYTSQTFFHKLGF